MPINLVSWLANSFGDGEPDTPAEWWRVDLTVRIIDIGPFCGTREQAIEAAKNELRGALGTVDDFEFTDANAKREEV